MVRTHAGVPQHENPANQGIGLMYWWATTLVVLLVMVVVPTATQAQQQQQNQGGGLTGEIFGAGAPGDNGKNGMDHAWDGKTETWFDCVAPPADFWDSCYTGIKLAKPTPIGQIRFCKK